MLFDPAASALCARPKRAPAEVAAEMDEDFEDNAALHGLGGETHWHVWRQVYGLCVCGM